MIKMELLLSLFIVMISVPSGTQIQIYDSVKAPIRLRLTSSGKNIELVNHSDQRVDALSLGCVSESPDGNREESARMHGSWPEVSNSRGDF